MHPGQEIGCVVGRSWNVCDDDVERQYSIEEILRSWGYGFCLKKLSETSLVCYYYHGFVRSPNVVRKVIERKRQCQKFFVIDCEF